MSSVSYTEGSWEEPSARLRWHYYFWQPTTARTLLVIVHGFGEHGGRYHAVAEELARQEICVVVPDLCGHGRSSGGRGDIRGVAYCASSLNRMTDEVFLTASGQSQYALFGHSFGGLVAMRWALEAPSKLRRMVIQSPLLEAGFPIPRWKMTIAALLARWMPACSLSTNLDANGISHDSAAVQAYRTDPLVHNRMSARSYQSILKTRDEAFARAASISVPTLLLYGTGDRIVSIAEAQRWFDRLTCEKRCVAFPESYHELHHEPVRGEVLRLIREWILAPS